MSFRSQPKNVRKRVVAEKARKHSGRNRTRKALEIRRLKKKVMTRRHSLKRECNSISKVLLEITESCKAPSKEKQEKLCERIAIADRKISNFFIESVDLEKSLGKEFCANLRHELYGETFVALSYPPELVEMGLLDGKILKAAQNAQKRKKRKV